MLNTEYEEFVKSETGNWNVARSYAQLKIMKPLYEIDYYLKVAKFGFEEFSDEVLYIGRTDNFKIKALKRALFTLQLVADNSYFACKKDVETLYAMITRLERIENVFNQCYKLKTNFVNKTKEMHIIDDVFNEILKDLLEIKRKMPKVLTKNHLIFTDKEEFDIHEYKKSIIENAVERG